MHIVSLLVNIVNENVSGVDGVIDDVVGDTGVGNPVEVEGRGSTGRVTPNTLNEQMAMHQVQSNPLKGATELKNIVMSDPRWPAS